MSIKSETKCFGHERDECEIHMVTTTMLWVVWDAFKIINRTFSRIYSQKGEWSNGIMNWIKFVCLHNSFNYGDADEILQETSRFVSPKGLSNKLHKRNRYLNMKIGNILWPFTTWKVSFYCTCRCFASSALNKVNRSVLNVFIAKVAAQTIWNHIYLFIISERAKCCRTANGNLYFVTATSMNPKTLCNSEESSTP